MGNIIGADLQPWAKDQVDLRQRLSAKTPFGIGDNELNQGEILQYLNGKTAWLRAASSAFITREKSIELTGDGNYLGRGLAKEYVLFNGTTGISRDIDSNFTSPTFGTEYDSFTPTFKAGVANNVSSINSFAYGLGGVEQGLVPMPGLTSLSIQTYNRGSLRKASLKLVCHNRNQFQIIDSLYMRPGFTILIEWGHTSYFTGNVDNPRYRNSPNFNTDVFFNFFKNNSLPQTDVTQELLLRNIRTERENTAGNYDGFYGHITNFKWDYKENGTYDIEVTAVSVGDVIESLNINRVKTKDNYTVPLEQRSAIQRPSGGSAVNRNAVSLNGNKPGQGDFTVEFEFNSQARKHLEYWTQTQGLEISIIRAALAKYPQSNVAGGTVFGLGVSDIPRGLEDKYIGTNIQNQPTVIQDTQLIIQELWKQFKNNIAERGAANKFKILEPPKDVIQAEEINDKISILQDENRSKFNGFLYKVYDYAVTNLNSSKTNKKVNSNSISNDKVTCFAGPITEESTGEKFANDDFDVVALQTFVVLNVVGGVSGTVMSHTTRASKNYPFVYIKLGRILEYIERNLLIYNTDENDTSNGESIVNIDTNDDNFCFTFPFQYSINPYVCVIPFSVAAVDYEPSKDKDEGNVKVKSINFDSFTPYWEEVLGDSFRRLPSDYAGSLLDIHVNIHFVTDLIKKLTTDNSLPLLAFLESMMSGIQEALGSVNKFTVTYDHDENTIKITDDIPLDPTITGITRETLTTFNVLGFQESTQEGSFVTDVKLATTITNQLASMIAISAQTKKASDVINSTGLMKFNEGIQDAIYPQKVSVVAAEQKTLTPEEIMYKTYFNLTTLKGSVVDSFYKTGTACSTELVDSQQTLASSFFRYKASDYGAKGTVVTQTFFPFSLGLDMDGFSGARIYERFTINNQVLPPSYPKISFVIKGLNHKIDKNGWSTDIDSLAYEAVEDTLTQSNTEETTPRTLKLNRQVRRPGLGIGELSNEELFNLGN